MAYNWSSIRETYSKTVCESKNNRVDFRLIEYVDKEGATKEKFGLSELFYCEQLGRWLPSKKHHVYLPLSSWLAVIDQGKVLEEALARDVARASRDGAIINATTAVSATATTAEVAGQHGRPPKRVDVYRANSGQSDDSGSVNDCPTAQAKNADQPTKTKAKRGRPCKSQQQATPHDFNANDTESAMFNIEHGSTSAANSDAASGGEHVPIETAN
jgi:hypothetical protein